MIDVEAFGAAMGDLIREAVAPLRLEISDLKKQLADTPDYAKAIDEAVQSAFKALPVPQNGKDCDMDAVKAHIDAMVKSIPVQNGKDGEPGKDGTNGYSVKLEDVQPLVADAVKSIQAEVQDFIKSVPLPQDGKSVTIDDVRPMLDEAVQQMRKDADTVMAEPLQAVEKAREFLLKSIAEFRQPEDGKPGKNGENGKDGAPGQKGADGIGLAGAMIDREGSLLVTLTNGEVKSLGQVVGKDGTHGTKGENGRDGMGFDDLKVEYDGEKTITLKMQQGDVIKEANIVMPINIDRGIYKEGTPYLAGDSVTWGGSYWIAKQDTSAKPDSPDSGWRLAVKRGRDGKDGRNGIDKTAPVALKD